MRPLTHIMQLKKSLRAYFNHCVCVYVCDYVFVFQSFEKPDVKIKIKKIIVNIVPLCSAK